MPNYGLGILSGLLGGAGKGLYEGYSGGIADQQKAAQLAEQQRQFNKSRVIDFSALPPALRAQLGLSEASGEIPTALAPALLVAGEKEAARQEENRRNQAGAAALRQAATEFPENTPRPQTPALDLNENPEAAGTPPPTQPNRILNMLAGLQETGVRSENPMLVQWLRNQMGPKPGQSEFFAPHYIQREDGSIVAVQQPKATGLPAHITDTGEKGITSRSTLNSAITAFQQDPTPKNWERLQILARPIMNAPGGNVLSAPMVAGMQPPVGATGPQSPVMATNPALPGNDALQDISQANAAAQQLQSVIQILKSGGLNDVLGGALKNPSGAKNRLTETYLGYGLTDQQRQALGTLSMQMQNIKHALIGATRTVPELKDIAAAIPDEKGLLRGDTAEQMIPKLESLLSNLRAQVSTRTNAMQTTGIRTPAANMPAANGDWVDLGNGVRIRQKSQ